MTKLKRDAVYAKTNGHCAYCGCEIAMRQMQVDHVFPQSICQIDDMDNLLPTCRSCNHYKNSMFLETFRSSIEKWPDVLKRDSVTYRNAIRYGLIEQKPRKIEFYFEKIGLKVMTWQEATERMDRLGNDKG